VSLFARIKNAARRVWQAIVRFFEAGWHVAVKVLKALVRAVVRSVKSGAAFIRRFLPGRDNAVKLGSVLCLKAMVQARRVAGLHKPFLKAIPRNRNAIELPAVA